MYNYIDRLEQVTDSESYDSEDTLKDGVWSIRERNNEKYLQINQQFKEVKYDQFGNLEDPTQGIESEKQTLNMELRKRQSFKKKKYKHYFRNLDGSLVNTKEEWTEALVRFLEEPTDKTYFTKGILLGTYHNPKDAIFIIKEDHIGSKDPMCFVFEKTHRFNLETREFEENPYLDFVGPRPFNKENLKKLRLTGIVGTDNKDIYMGKYGMSAEEFVEARKTALEKESTQFNPFANDDTCPKNGE